MPPSALDDNTSDHVMSESGFSATTRLTSHTDNEPLDLLCIGFGPASLAIAIALQDAHPSGKKPRAMFLERQSSFAWHAGMQIPGAKMQISFLKDLATPRNPRSYFTFLNYLQTKGRFAQFVNLGTFLPTRLEYEDYLRWCAGFFEEEGVVRYGQDVLSVVPEVSSKSGKVVGWSVASRDSTGEVVSWKAKKIVVAVGGKANLPENFPQNHPLVVHSSKYHVQVNNVLTDKEKPYNIAVIGSGQSAAEIYNDLPGRFPNAKISLIIKGASLRPSDDSPFVNEIFDPDRVDEVYSQDPEQRAQAIALDKATNYGVVRLNLLEHLYEQLYIQRLRFPNKKDWKINILNHRHVEIEAGKESLKLRVTRNDDVGHDKGHDASSEEIMDADAVFVATGYVRNAHEELLRETRGLLPSWNEDKKFPVARDYRVKFDGDKVEGQAGIWLQGCNEATHGLSDTLLSILAIRSGELVESMFGKK